MLDKDIVNSLKGNIDIADVIGRFVSLKKNGTVHKGLCPFHKENTPSFTVTSKLGIYKCYGCGESGDVITFVRKHENMSFIATLHWLAAEYNIPIGDDKSRAMRQPKFDKLQVNEDDKPGDYEIEYEDMTEDDIRIWFAKSIVDEHYKPNKPDEQDGLAKLYDVLKELKWRRVKSLTRVSKDSDTGQLKKTRISSTDIYPIYAREEDWKIERSGAPAIKGSFVKVYQPLHHDKKRKFMFNGDVMPDFISGLSQASAAYEKLVQEENERMEEDDDEDDNKKKKNEPIKLQSIMICSGERDAANAKAMDLDIWPVWPNSESAKIHPGALSRLFQLAKNVYNCPDIDEPGLENMHRLAMTPSDEKYLEIKHVILPRELRAKWSNGKPCKDLRDYLNHWNKWDFKKMMADAMPYRFWQFVVTQGKFGITEKYSIDNEVVFFFLQQNGFWQFQLNPEGSDVPEMCFVHINNNVVSKVLPSDIKNWVVNFLRKRKFPRDLRNAVLRSTYFGANMLDALLPINPDFKAHTPDSQLMFFQNKVWEIRAEGITEHLPGRLKGKYVWSDKVIKHNVSVQKTPPFTITYNKEDGLDITINDDSSLFMQFLKRTSEIHWRVVEEGVKMADGSIRKTKLPEEIHEEKLILINKLYALGYLSHRQKFNHRGWYVYGMEYHVTGEGKSSGGTGKSAFFGLLPYYLRVFRTPGSRKADDDNHRYGGVTEHTDIVYYDDIHEFFDWRNVYELTTGEFHVNPKNKPGFSIPYHKSPKLCGTGNFAVRDINGSTSRRLLYVVFSDYFHSANPATNTEERNIFDELGKQLYTDFNEADWNSTFNIIAESIRFYMWNPTGYKINPPMENVWYKNLRSHIGETFINWAEVVFHPDFENTDCFIPREVLQEDYTNKLKASNLGRLAPSPQVFKEKLDMYCRLTGMSFMPADVLNLFPKPKKNEAQRTMKWIPGLQVTKEVFYIQTVDENGNPNPIDTMTVKLDITKPKNPMKADANYVADGLDKPDEGDLPF